MTFYNMFVNTSIFIARILLCVFKDVLITSVDTIAGRYFEWGDKLRLAVCGFWVLQNDAGFKEAAVHLGLDITKVQG